MAYLKSYFIIDIFFIAVPGFAGISLRVVAICRAEHAVAHAVDDFLVLGHGRRQDAGEFHGVPDDEVIGTEARPALGLGDGTGLRMEILISLHGSRAEALQEVRRGVPGVESVVDGGLPVGLGQVMADFNAPAAPCQWREARGLDDQFAAFLRQGAQLAIILQPAVAEGEGWRDGGVGGTGRLSSSHDSGTSRRKCSIVAPVRCWCQNSARNG